jgi:hypothetical protein
MPRSRLRSLPKVTVAFAASALGVLLPWRARVWYSESLGWVAQLVPPRFYAVKGEEAGDERA